MARKKTTCDFCNKHCGPQYVIHFPKSTNYICVGAACLKRTLIAEWNRRMTRWTNHVPDTRTKAERKAECEQE
jgi:hypothetical protein